MDLLVVGFWGAYFGTAALMLAASLAAWIRLHRRVALAAALASVMSALFAVAYLGWLPLADPALEARLLALVAAVCASVLGLMLLATLGLLRQPQRARRVRVGMYSLSGVTVAVGWLLTPAEALALSSVVAISIGVAALVAAFHNARRGDRQAWVSVSGVGFMLIALLGLSWIALDRGGVPPAVHIGSAIAANAYLTIMAGSLWLRYSYLLELHEVMAQGPSYDPVTRMRSHAETAGQMVGTAFFPREGERRTVGVVVVSIGNLYALENLHGRAAVNHALFVCASRLRRIVPLGVDMGRLADDGFLLLMRDADDPQVVAQLARQLALRLSRPVILRTGGQAGDIEVPQTQWTADVGVGMLQALPGVRAASAVAMARAMSRTAWTYGSRLAWFDHAAEQIAELPADPRA